MKPTGPHHLLKANMQPYYFDSFLTKNCYKHWVFLLAFFFYRQTYLEKVWDQCCIWYVGHTGSTFITGAVSSLAAALILLCIHY